ncbi:efflux transporter outer membrane subunit [Caballeronia sordidicola]|uniref:Heavy metal RND efflux outer membrane protein, CzcC family n=1 Tax=Caballeronia sordidicola TaxID=196367 RepID=A0A242M3Z7_CABSO|nr:efflux transporter outer membrane subunit [Caballeronia sordidicola]OTP65746.1 Heavy metal RND efflux outer membrane protein, CzcC family [Caballeronia sordidicola]
MSLSRLSSPLSCLALAALTACSTIPPYTKPDVSMPAHYANVPGWTVASPEDAASRGQWWTVFHDADLDRLESRVNVSNQTVKKVVAQLEQARAVVTFQQAGFFPTVTANASEQRYRTSQNLVGKALAGKTIPDYSAGLTASWEPDLFGRVKDAAVNAQANADASNADLEAVRLSVASDIATDYFDLRALDTQKKLLVDTITAYAAALKLLQQQLADGAIDASAVAQAQTQLESTRTQATDISVQRSQLEHAIATLIGESASTFSIVPVERTFRLPDIPPGVPSQLLERRPDIAAAERRVVAANAQIGEAHAAYFPDLVLSASAGLESSFFAPWLTAPSLFWALGPQLVGTLFDGGRHKATLDQANARYDGAVADYRQSVLTSFQQVEDSLAALNALQDEAVSQERATSAATLALKLTTNRFQAGAVSYLDVVTAQTIALNNQRAREQIDARRLDASVSLIRALGGTWQTDAAASNVHAPG